MADTCACSKTEESFDFAPLDAFIETFPEEKRGRDVLIPVLHKAQDLYGYLPQEVQRRIAAALDLPVSEVYGVITFYHYFSTVPRGRHMINVCTGTACYVRGAKKVLEGLQKELGIEIGDTTEDRRFSLSSQRCFGACGLAPVVMINDDVHGRVSPKKIPALLAQYE